MKTYKPLLWLSLIIVLIISCEKEKSFEKGILDTSSGSLKSGTSGDCLGNALSGVYKADTTLTSTNYVDVQIDVTKTGSYVVSTDTINGFYFKATGTFSNTGVNTVRLQGIGTPAAPATNIFTVTYDSTQCTFSVPTLSGGSGGTSVFTLAGAPNACTGASVQGIYTAGVVVNSSNTATIQVDVTTAGTYTISTAGVDGITFNASGTFSATGTQSIDLAASGTPTAAGSFSVTIAVGSSNCSFPLTVVAGSPAAYTLNETAGNCTGATVQGTYTLNTSLTGTNNTATIQVNVTTPGTYSITTAAVNNITFTGSGIFSSTGVQSVVLTANGTPSVAGDNVISITVGSSSCTFTVTVDQGQTPDFVWQFTEGSVTYHGTSDVAGLQSVSGTNTFSFLGTTLVGDSSLTLDIINTGGAIQTGVNYHTNTSNPLTGFSFIDPALNTIYQADFTKTGVDLVVKLTTYDQVNQIISGTFSGTVKDASNVTKTITNGSFTAQIQ